jgi:HK97 gp10 family phage protein
MSAGIIDILEFVTVTLPGIERDMRHAERKIVGAAAAILAKQARSYIGTYDAEPRWPELAASTQKQRVSKGYSANKPLKRSGKLKDSITFDILSDREAIAGSTDERAPFFEFGTSRMPPRPFMLPAIHESGPKIEKLTGRIAVAALSARGNVHSSQLAELMHLLHDLERVGHKLKEDLVDPYIENEKGERSR